MPCDKQTSEALEDYSFMITKLKGVIEENNVNSILLIGDFNADPTKGRFWNELLIFIR